MEDNGYNHPYNGYVMGLNDFWQATAIIINCFKAEVNSTGNLVNIEQTCTAADYEATMKENKILDWAISTLRS